MDSPATSATSTRYLPGLTLKVNPPALFVVACWRSPESTLTTSTWRPTIELVPSGPRTVPLMVPSVDCEASPGFRIGVPRRHDVTLMNATVNAATQSSAISGAR